MQCHECGSGQITEQCFCYDFVDGAVKLGTEDEIENLK